jgi:hypothetical protein
MLSLSEIMFMAIVVYLLYRFIVNFLVPVMRATRQVREQFRNMHDQANGGRGPSEDGTSHGGFGPGYRPGTGPGSNFRPGAGAGFGKGSAQGSGAGTGAATRSGAAGAREKQSSGKPPAEDYIDFEEIK